MLGALEDENRSKTETVRHVTGSHANLFLSPSLCWNVEVRVVRLLLAAMHLHVSLFSNFTTLFLKQFFYTTQSIKYAVFKGNDKKNYTWKLLPYTEEYFCMGPENL
jgi:hypothetical protein